MENTATNPEQVTLEETLNKTDFGHWLYENRKPLFIVLALIFLSASGYGVLLKYQQSRNKDIAAQVFDFRQTTFANLNESKIKDDEFITAFKTLPSEVIESVNMKVLVVEAVKKWALENKGQQMNQLLKLVYPSFKVQSFIDVLLGQIYMASLENLNQVDEALEVGKQIVTGPVKVMLPKVYLDLGRLNLLKKDTAQAKIHFDYVLANHPNSDSARLARLMKKQTK